MCFSITDTAEIMLRKQYSKKQGKMNFANFPDLVDQSPDCRS